MDFLPPMEEVLAALEKMKKVEEKMQRVFAPSVDLQDAARCSCECCPATEEKFSYCCRSLFSLPLLKKAISLRDGLLSKMINFDSTTCITKHPLFRDYILAEPAVRASAEMHSMLTGDSFTNTNQELRYAAYRLFVASSLGHRGKGVGMRLPTCFIQAVRQRWPSPEYNGFSVLEIFEL